MLNTEKTCAYGLYQATAMYTEHICGQITWKKKITRVANVYQDGTDSTFGVDEDG